LEGSEEAANARNCSSIFFSVRVFHTTVWLAVGGRGRGRGRGEVRVNAEKKKKRKKGEKRFVPVFADAFRDGGETQRTSG
jgi:hypothetical protein